MSNLYLIVCTRQHYGDLKFQIDVYGSRAEAVEARRCNYIGQTWDDLTLMPVSLTTEAGPAPFGVGLGHVVESMS